MIIFNPLYKLLDERKITLKDLSIQMGYTSPTALSSMIANGTSVALVADICKALKCSVGDVIAIGEEQKKRTSTGRKSHGIPVNWDKIASLDLLSKISIEIGCKNLNALAVRKSRNAGLPEELINAICEKYGVSKEDICAQNN